MKILRNKGIILLYLNALLTYCLMAQPFNYFNYRYDISGTGVKDDCYAILEVDNGFVLAGSSLVISGNIYWWEKKITKIDGHGIVQSIHTFGEDSVDYFFTNSGCIIKDSNNFYAVGKRRTPTPNGLHDEGTLMYINENLDTLWMKRYGEMSVPYDTAYLFTCIQKVNQENLIIAGAWKPIGLASHVYLLKTDSLGNKIWENSYSYFTEYIEAYSISQTSDQGFIIGCMNHVPGYNYTVDPVIIKTDSNGNQEWMKNLGSDYMDNKAMVTISEDSMIIVGTNFADSMYTPDVGFSVINILKIDNKGNVIWDKKYGESKPNNYLLNIKVLEDSCIVAVGSIRKYNPEPDWAGWILKVSSDGDSLWYREYNYLSGQESKNYLYDIYETFDNGLIACGYMTPFPPDTGSTDTWVIKLDSIGCDTAGCDPTVWIAEEEKTRRGEGEIDIELWPNPCSTVLCISLSSTQPAITTCHPERSEGSHSSYTVDIYDIFGRKVCEEITSSTRMGEGRERGWTIDVSALPSGIYLLVLKGGMTVKASSKFVVTR